MRKQVQGNKMKHCKLSKLQIAWELLLERAKFTRLLYWLACLPALSCSYVLVWGYLTVYRHPSLPHTWEQALSPASRNGKSPNQHLRASAASQAAGWAKLDLVLHAEVEAWMAPAYCLIMDTGSLCSIIHSFITNLEWTPTICRHSSGY